MTTDEIVFQCPKGEATLKGKSTLAGKEAKCPKCGEVTTVPEASDEGSA